MIALYLTMLLTAEIKVVATTPDLAAVAREIGGAHVTVTTLSRPNQNPHQVTATPSMIVGLSKADVLVFNGLELEIGWVPALVESSRNGKIRAGRPGHVDASRKVPVIDRPTGPIDRSMGDVHPGGNPHYTFDPGRAKWAAWNIADALTRVDPAHTEDYKLLLKKFYDRADQAVKNAKESMTPFQGSHVIVYHTYYNYLLNRLGLSIVASIEPRPGIPPSAAHIAKLIRENKDKGIKIVIIEPWHDRRLAEQVAAGIGAKVIVPCAGVGACPEATDVVTLFEKNVALIRSSLANP